MGSHKSRYHAETQNALNYMMIGYHVLYNPSFRYAFFLLLHDVRETDISYLRVL